MQHWNFFPLETKHSIELDSRQIKGAGGSILQICKWQHERTGANDEGQLADSVSKVSRLVVQAQRSCPVHACRALKFAAKALEDGAEQTQDGKRS